MSEQTPSPPPPTPHSDRRRIALAALGGGLSVILLGAGALAVAGIARADSPSPSTSNSAQTPSGPGGPHDGWGGRPGWGMPGPGGLGGFGSLLGPGVGLGGALHGQVVVKTGDGSFQTFAGQRGTVTAVSATSISVKSEDGYEATYTVDKDTVVIGADKVTDLANNANVGVVAKVAGDSSSATRIIDLDAMMTKMRQFANQFGHGFRHGPWRSGAPKATPSPSSTS